MEYNDIKFLKWYTRAVGGLIGIYTCIYCYLSGEIIIYQNINKYIDSISFSSLLASYALLPLCIAMMLASLLQARGVSSKFMSWTLSVVFITIGFMGCKQYFVFAGVVVILNLFIESSKYESTNESSDIEIDQETHDTVDKYLQTEPSDIPNKDITKEMVIDLLENKADKSFIMDMTGLSLEHIEYIEKNYK